MKKRASRMTPIREYFKFKECYWHSAQTLTNVEERCAYYDAVINMGLCGELPNEDEMPDGAYHAWMDQKWRLTTSVQNHKNGKENRPKLDKETGEVTDDSGGVAPQSAISETKSERASEAISEEASERASETEQARTPTNTQASSINTVPDSVTGRPRDRITGLFID